MKKLLLLLALICSIIAAPVVFTGCGTPQTVQASTFKTLKSVQLGVDAALKVYATARVTGKVTPTKRIEVEQKRAAYQAAFRIAVQQARNNQNAAAPPTVQQLANELQALITAL